MVAQAFKYNTWEVEIRLGVQVHLKATQDHDLGSNNRFYNSNLILKPKYQDPRLNTLFP